MWLCIMGLGRARTNGGQILEYLAAILLEWGLWGRIGNGTHGLPMISAARDCHRMPGMEGAR